MVIALGSLDVRIDEIRAQVAADYDRLGLLSWPDPHPDMASPKAEEYSRVTRPERFRIVAARARVWADVLGAISGIGVEPMAVKDVERAGPDNLTNALRLRSTRPRTLPLLLLLRQVPARAAAGTMTALHICAERASVVLAGVPACGCDACDGGSDSLLAAIDDTISGFVSAPSVLLRGPGWQADWRPDGGSSGGDGDGPDHNEMMHICHRLWVGQPAPMPAGSEAFINAVWLD